MRLIFILFMNLELGALIAQSYGMRPNLPCISTQDHILATKQINQTQAKLKAQQKINPRTNQVTKLSWPLQPKTTFSDPSYYIILQYVDHDETYGSTLDYNCGHRTYDLQGYNHAGTDIGLWPFPWKMLEEAQIQVVAAADGYISAKSDGGFDRVCAWGSGGAANYVILTHEDGSQTWYWHLKEGSVTTLELGTKVRRGDYLGLVASSGFSNYPHLHFEVQDVNGQLVDPYAGNCNDANNTSWWISQPTYWLPALVKLSTHRGTPFYEACPQPELTKEQNTFNPGQEIYFSAFTRDLRTGQSIHYRIINSQGQVFNSWVFESVYDAWAEYRYWVEKLPLDVPLGPWIFEAVFQQDTFRTGFTVNNECLPPADLRVQKVGSTSAVLAWNKEEQNELWLNFRRHDEPVWQNISIPKGAQEKTLNRLTPEVEYHWRLAKICNPGDTAWTDGPSFKTATLSYFDPERITFSPTPATPSDEIWMEVSGFKKIGGYLKSSSILAHKGNQLEVQLDWADSLPDETEFLPHTFNLRLGSFSENYYRVTFSGTKWRYENLSGEYGFEVQICPGISLKAQAWSATTIGLYSEKLTEAGSHVIRYRQGKEEWQYDTLTRTLCIYPPCPVLTTNNLEIRQSQLLLRNLTSCTEYEIQLKLDCVQDEFSKSAIVNTECQILPCHTPFNLKVDQVQLTGIQISWDDSTKSGPLDSYVITYRQLNDEKWQRVQLFEGGSSPIGLHYHQAQWFPGCLCASGCFTRPIWHPLPQTLSLQGLLPCNDYELKVSKECLDTTGASASSITVKTTCFPASEGYAYSLFPPAGGIINLNINGYDFSDSCDDCLGCRRPGYQKIDQSLNVGEESQLHLKWGSSITGQGEYLDLLGRRYPFPAGGNIKLYQDADQDGLYDALVYTGDGPQTAGSIDLDLPASNQQLISYRLVYSYLDEPVPSGRIHFGNVVDFKLERSVTSTTPGVGSPDFTINPNPAAHTTRLNITSLSTAAQLLITNVTGKIIYQQGLLAGATSVSLDLEGFPAGVYLIYLRTGNTAGLRKLVVKN